MNNVDAGILMNLKKSESPKYIFRDEAANGKYYHYTNFDGFWKIIENESLLATQALFSNDSQELNKGKKLLESDKVIMSKVNEINVDGYIICFCKENDKLSQWRGYCRNGGVSFEFEINNTGLDSTNYYLIKDDEKDNCSLSKAIETYLYPVIYLADDENNQWKEENIKKGESIITELKHIISGRKTEYQISRIINSSVPLIKDIGFYEENEYRVLFENYIESGSNKGVLEDYVKYRDKANKRTPYVTVKFEKSHYEEWENVEKVFIVVDKKQIKKSAQNLINANIVTERGKETFFEDYMKKSVNHYQVNIIEKVKKVQKYCQNQKIEFEILINDDWCLKIGVGNNQKEVFNQIDLLVNYQSQKKNENIIPIFCEGHLPVRSVMISPLDNQDEVYESLRHYFKHGDKFWLKYVNISKSSIPYREPK